MSLVNFTSLQFSLCFFYEFAVFNIRQKHLDDKIYWRRRSFRLDPFSHEVASDIQTGANHP